MAFAVQQRRKRADKFKGKCPRCGQTSLNKKDCKKKEVYAATSHKNVGCDKPTVEPSTSTFDVINSKLDCEASDHYVNVTIVLDVMPGGVELDEER